MEEIKKFIISYFKAEATARFNSFKPNIKVFNDSLKELHTNVVSEMYGRLGMIELKKPESENFYKDYEWVDSYNPRHLFKISHYKHTVYGEVWVCYTSGTNPDLEFPVLTHALFVIKEDNQYKVARNYIYSNYSSDGLTFEWSGGAGLQDLTFESLGDLVSIERYLEPLDFHDALKLYNEDA